MSLETKATRTPTDNLKDLEDSTLETDSTSFDFNDLTKSRDVNFLGLMERYFFQEENTIIKQAMGENGAMIEEKEDICTSLPSRGLIKIDVPEPSIPVTQFFYNYYTPDERSRKYSTNANQIVNRQENFTNEEIKHIVANKGTAPRYVKVTTQGVQNISEDLMTDFQSENIDPNNFLNFINIEGANTNDFYTGIELIDTVADDKIYNLLSSSIVFTMQSDNIDTGNMSQKEIVNAFKEKIIIDGVKKEDKIILQSIMNNLQPEGVLIANSDVSKEKIEEKRNPLSKQSFSLQFNNLFFNDIIDNATHVPCNVYEDELRGLKEVSKEIQSNLIASIDPNLVYDHEYEARVQPYFTKDISIYFSELLEGVETVDLRINEGEESPYESMGENEVSISNATGVLKSLFDIYPDYKIIGQVLTKYEVTVSGPIKFIDNIIITNGQGVSEIIDKNVAYGAAYVYKIRNIALVKDITRSSIQSKGEGTEVVYKINHNIILSEGKLASCQCIETTPPSPPTNLNIAVDYNSRRPKLTWQFPANKQRDIKKFQIYKRKNINLPFTLICEYDFDNSSIRTNYVENINESVYIRTKYSKAIFLDKEFNLEEDEAIYAVVSIDAHGYSSNYSAQIHVKYDKFTNTIINTLVSGPGAPKPYPNFKLSADFFEDVIKSSNKHRLHLFFDPEYYKIFSKTGDPGNQLGIQQKLGFGGQGVVGYESIDYLKTSTFDTNEENYPYLFHFINIDNQKDQTLKVKIIDKSGAPEDIPASEISANNLSFEFVS